MDIEEIKAKVRANQYIYSHHADLERRADDLTLAQVEDALLTGAILEQYPDFRPWRKLFGAGFFTRYSCSCGLWVTSETRSCSSLDIFPVRHNLLIRGHEERVNEGRGL